MSSEGKAQDASPQAEKPAETGDAQMETTAEPPTAPAAMASANRKRPRLDLAADTREKKRGKSMFGLLVGTLNKAKNEDKERNATEAARKRQLIDQRLQDKLKKETDSVRRAEESKKEKQTSNRKEEELQLKDSIYKLRRTRLPVLANFLLTSDIIPTDEDAVITPSETPLVPVPRSYPPPLYYLPAILTPAQDKFLKNRKSEVQDAVEKEWQEFRDERTAGIAEIKELRQRVAEEDSRQKVETKDDLDQDAEPTVTKSNGTAEDKPGSKQDDEAKMEVDEPSSKEEPLTKGNPEPEHNEDQSPAMRADEDDAVEY